MRKLSGLVRIYKCQKPEFAKAGKPLKRRMYQFEMDKGLIIVSPVWAKGDALEWTSSMSIGERRFNQLIADGSQGIEVDISELKLYVKDCPEIGKKAEQHTYRILKIELQ